jgi:hypothetical protein
MESIPLTCSPNKSEIGVYDCEINLKFRLIEDKSVLGDRDRLLELLLDAFSYGSDEFLETLRTNVDVREIPETETSPQMRRQLIRLRNACA